MSSALDTAVLSFSEDEKMTYVETKFIDVKGNGILKGTFIKHGHHCFMSFGSAVELQTALSPGSTSMEKSAISRHLLYICLCTNVL